MTGIKEVTEYLAREGFNVAGTDIRLDEVSIAFDAVLSSPNDAAEFVVLLDYTSTKTIQQFTSNINALLVLLSRAESMRVLTVVLVGYEGLPDALAPLRALCRLAVVAGQEPPEVALRAILPLKLPTPIEPEKSGDTLLRDRLEANDFTSFALETWEKATEGNPQIVKDHLIRTIDQIVRSAK